MFIQHQNDGGIQKSLENHRLGPKFDTCNVSLRQLSLFYVLGPLTAELVMSVELVVFSVFHLKTMDQTAKTRAKFETFCSRELSALSFHPLVHTYTQIHCTDVSCCIKKHHVHRNTPSSFFSFNSSF